MGLSNRNSRNQSQNQTVLDANEGGPITDPGGGRGATLRRQKRKRNAEAILNNTAAHGHQLTRSADALPGLDLGDLNLNVCIESRKKIVEFQKSADKKLFRIGRRLS